MLYMIHGLNGSRGSWAKVNTAVMQGAPGFPPRKVYSKTPDDGSSQTTIADVAFTLICNSFTFGVNLPSDYDSTYGIIIAHSQGGLASCYVDSYDSITSNQHQ